MLKTMLPEQAEREINKIGNCGGKINKVIPQLLSQIPLRRYSDLIDYSRGKLIRVGLTQFLNFLQVKKVPFVVVSGGLKDMAKTILGKYRLLDRVCEIHALELKVGTERFEYEEPVPGKNDENNNDDSDSFGELVPKIRVIEKYIDKYSVEEIVFIGDGLTDLHVIQKLDEKKKSGQSSVDKLSSLTVFARGELAEILKEETDIEFTAWETFIEIFNELAKKW
jgi:2-hydroxy-3-keto-5-methylthiopentenyl-1-phosphate phosphatase